MIINAIRDLPKLHRDTLAYLVVHWKKIVSYSKKTPVSLEDYVGPVVVGGGRSKNTLDENLLKVQQTSVMQKLLYLNTEFWTGLIELDTNANTRWETPKTATMAPRFMTPMAFPHEQVSSKSEKPSKVLHPGLKLDFNE